MGGSYKGIIPDLHSGDAGSIPALSTNFRAVGSVNAPFADERSAAFGLRRKRTRPQQ